jgi:hypothetical protein
MDTVDKKIEYIDLIHGTVTQAIVLQGHISRGFNSFRDPYQWRGVIHKDGIMEWQWCESKEEAIEWVMKQIPHGFVPRSQSEQAEKDRLHVIRTSEEHGDFVTDVDGFVYFWPMENRGSMAAHHLRWLADELDKRNQGWQKTIDNYFNNEVQ